MTTTMRNRLLLVLVLLAALVIAVFAYSQFGGKKMRGQAVRRERAAAAFQERQRRGDIRGHNVGTRQQPGHAATGSAQCPVGWTCSSTVQKGACVQFKAPDTASWGNACGTASCRGRCYR